MSFMSELVCYKCSATAHVTWDGTDGSGSPLEQSDNIEVNVDERKFTCLSCGTEQTIP
jgi:hypothetical protein